MPMNSTSAVDSLLGYLPAIYQQDEFIGQFLLAFEEILLGHQNDTDFPYQGLEKKIANLALYFDPIRTREDFLPWLASWTALSLRANLKKEEQRKLIARIISLYRWRGTRKNLQDLLGIFTIGVPTVYEPDAAEFQVGVHSRIGLDTFVGGAPPHYFRVTLALARASPEVQQQQMKIVRDLIELEKPAHTTYDLEINFPSMRIGRNSTVGIDTLLGVAQEED